LDDARVIALMQAYLDAEYRWEWGGEWYPMQIGTTVSDLEATFPDGREFGLFSAWNPYSVERPEETNRAADAALHAALRGSGAIYRPGFSSARNRSWREPSWVTVDLPLAEFDALASRFGQLGTLYCHRGEPLRLRMYRARPAAVAAPFVDWLPATDAR
jgi:hypothetical protein